MGVIGKQRDQGEEQGGKNRDPALTVKSQNHRSQPKPLTQDSTGKLSGGIRGIAAFLGVAMPLDALAD